MKHIVLSSSFAFMAALLTVSSATLEAQTYDFGDHSSATLTGKAWAANEAKDWPAVLAYTNKCIEMYMAEAVKMQASLTEVPKGEPEATHTYWALNDVGTCLFIKGMAYEAQGNTKEAVATYKTLVEKLPFSQCWDLKGWFWKPADGAAGKIKALEFDAM